MFAYSGFSCSFPDAFVPCQSLRQDMGLLRGLVQAWKPPSLKHALHGTDRRPKQGPAGVKCIEMWRRALDVPNWEQTSVHSALGRKVRYCPLPSLLRARAPGWSGPLDWAPNYPICNAPRSTNHNVEAIIYKGLPGRSSRFLTPLSTDYFFHLPHLLAPSSSILIVLRGFKAEMQVQSQDLEKEQTVPTLLSSLQRTGLRHPPGNSSEKNIHLPMPLA